MAEGAQFELSNVKIPSRTPGWNLDAWKYIPSKNNTSGPLPVIVMQVLYGILLDDCDDERRRFLFRAHGFSANKKMGLGAYAEAFVSKGYACVVFDYRRFGDSGMLATLVQVRE